MKLKKIMAAVLSCAIAAASVMAVTGCDDASKKDKDTYTVGICQLVQHEALDAATEGFKDALTEKLGDKVTFDEQNGAGDSANCTTIINQFVSSNVDLIMANATPALQAAVAGTADIPIVGTSVTDYGVALDMKDFNGKTGINVTGASDAVPFDKQADMIKELVPDATKAGILYCSNEANSKVQSDVAEEELKKLGLEVTVYTFADSNDLAQVVTKACSEVEAIYIPTDNTCASNTESINSIAEAAGIPIIAGEESICKGCGVATLTISYYNLGYAAGLQAYDILVNGKNPGDIEIGSGDPVYKYVPERCEKLNITVPENYEAIEG